MKPSILVVMLDFLVCSLLLFVVGESGTPVRQPAATQPATIHADYSPSAVQAMEEQWSRDYDQQALLAQLSAETSAKEKLKANLNETTVALAARTRETEELKNLAAQRAQAVTALVTEKAKVEQEKTQVVQTLSSVESKLTTLSTEHSKLEKEKTELKQRAEQLGQTVASQQSTIQTLSEEVRASQQKMESQFTDFAHNQQEMNSTLGELDAFARTLPATVKAEIGTVHDSQRDLQDVIAALMNSVRDLQAGLSSTDNQALLQAVTDVAHGQQQLQSQVETLIQANESNQVGQTLGRIQTGQDALRQQTTQLAEQIETIKAGKPGPFKAVKGARLELLVAIAQRDNRNTTVRRFQSTAYPPVINANGRSFIVAHSQHLGLNWSPLSSAPPNSEITEVKYTIAKRSETPWSTPLTGAACVLTADPHVVAVELERPVPELTTMELAGADAMLSTDQRKLHVFKTTAAGLSFEVDTSPDLGDTRYLVVKRSTRGVASWFENPAYRADVGDYLVTSDGKLVGVMITREKCLILRPADVTACSLTVSLTDRTQFQIAANQFSKIR